ncbi:MAG: hypothetical protein IKX62_04715, partial [Bacteroidales bacterium]|nr:hypothetical protein [Bacteroidales bacterium]
MANKRYFWINVTFIPENSAFVCAWNGFACSLQSRARARLLHDVESYINDRPDSALAVLRGIQTRNLSGFHVRSYYALLLSEALDKNYIDLTDDSLAMVANRYYGDHGSKLHRVKSWYY